MLVKSRKKQAGLSLIEILVGLTIGIVITAAIVSIFSNAITSTEQMLDSGRLNQALESAMNTIVSDVQRTGYWYKTDYTTNNTNPFLSGTDDLTTTSTCSTFSYDANTDGSISDSDRFGYRLSGGAIQYRTAGGTTCSAGSSWTNLTNPNLITITTFDVSVTSVPITGNNTDHTYYRTVTITIGGNLVNDSTSATTITRTIKLYNNLYTST